MDVFHYLLLGASFLIVDLPLVTEMISIPIYAFVIRISFMFLVSAINASNDSNTLWSSIILQAGNRNFSEKAVGIAVLEKESFIVAVERTVKGSSLTIPVLYKVNLSGTVLWARIAETVRGTPHDLVVDRKRKIVYIVVSSQQPGAPPYTDGYIVRFRGLYESVNGENAHLAISEDKFLKTESGEGNTKLFGCALDKTTNDLYVTGGSTHNLYGTSQGRSDVIVVRIASSGIIMTTAQFGTAHDEFGTAIDVSTSSAVVAVSIYRTLESGGTESVLYHLHPKTLAVIDGPTTLMNYAAVPLFIPTGIVIGEAVSPELDAMFTVICGGALTIPDHKIDIFFHMYAKINGADANVAVYVDGDADQKKNDYAVALEAGTDGNIYSVGYSKQVDPSLSTNVVLVVISPSGEILYRNGGAKDNGSEIVPSAMTLFSTNDGTRVAFVGHAQVGGTRKAIMGTAFPPVDEIPVFSGFKELAKGGGADSSQSRKNTKDPTSIVLLTILVAMFLGLILLLTLVALLLFRAHQRTKMLEGNGESALDGRRAQEHLSSSFGTSDQERM